MANLSYTILTFTTIDKWHVIIVIMESVRWRIWTRILPRLKLFPLTKDRPNRELFPLFLAPVGNGARITAKDMTIKRTRTCP
ncbi:MAG: hypothetical protein C3F07_15310 [Anaerolineales bacterium]|nr:MAG: hypothetical protein C3F07_15310 [Anaerolineales bacterium]